ncbi:retrovirus-related pol polyprotein from transposon TNT 1-94, partial [Tanacetum coccineum]
DDEQMVEEFKKEMMQVFEMTDLGLMSYYLGMEVHQNQNEVFVSQKKYAKEILKKFQMEECKAVTTPMCQKEKLSGEDDSDWAGSADDMKSTSGYCFTFSSGIFSWSSKKQETVAQSTAEAEFIAANAATNQALWLRKILTHLHIVQKKSTSIFVDNEAAIAISNNAVFHGKTKHFKIKFYHLREVQQAGEVTLVHCKSEDQLADLFTKPLPAAKFEVLRKRIGVCSA